MVIDSSALMSILLKEPDYLAISRAIERDSNRLVSACSALETSIAISVRKGQAGADKFESLLYRMDAKVIPFTRDHYILAREGWQRFGRTRHPASLNFGDCCTYALCLSTGEPLLFKGDDFSQTDLPLVSY